MPPPPDIGRHQPVTKGHQPVASPGGSAPILVGLTGAVAAGKSEALAAFARSGAATLSSDAVAHELLDSPEVREQLAKRWGEAVLFDGRVDREKVGEIVFGRPEQLAWLESVLHPLVGKRVLEWLRTLPRGTPLAVVEVPLLFEVGMEKVFDATVCVVTDDATRAARAGDRGTDMLEGRSGRQLSQDEKAARATHVISNDGSLAELEQQVAGLMPALTALAPGTA